MTYIRWSVMWHVQRDQGETWCGRMVRPGAKTQATRPDPTIMCAVCREYL